MPGPHPTYAFHDFLNCYHLTLEIYERPIEHPMYAGLTRYYACVPRVEAKNGSLLTGPLGNGDTAEAAVQGCVDRMNEVPLVIDAYRDSRQETGPFTFTHSPGTLRLIERLRNVRVDPPVADEKGFGESPVSQYLKTRLTPKNERNNEYVSD